MAVGPIPGGELTVTSRSSRVRRSCGGTRLARAASVLAFNDLRQARAPGVWQPHCINPAAFAQGAIVRIGFGSDQLRFECKEHLKNRFGLVGHAAEDASTGNSGRGDCRGVTDRLASATQTRRVERGGLICSRPIGASVMPNRRPAVRAAVCHDFNSACLGVTDDGMNLLVLGARVVTHDLASESSGIRTGSRVFGTERIAGRAATSKARED